MRGGRKDVAHGSIERGEKEGKRYNDAKQSRRPRRGMRGECPVACGKWGSNASGEATSRRGLTSGGKGPHLNSQYDSSLSTACCRAIVHTRYLCQFTTVERISWSTILRRVVYHSRIDRKVSSSWCIYFPFYSLGLKENDIVCKFNGVE